MWQDLRHGLRMLAKSPGFTGLAVLSIAIGVGANAAMFGVADTIVFRPLTVSRPGELVTVTAIVPRAGGFQTPSARSLSYPDYLDLASSTHSFGSLFAYRVTLAGLALRPEEPPRRAFGMAVTGRFFDTIRSALLLCALGVFAVMGPPCSVGEASCEYAWHWAQPPAAFTGSSSAKGCAWRPSGPRSGPW